MAIGTDDGILKFGTEDQVTVATPSAVDGNDGISTTSDINEWTNDDDATLVCAVFAGSFAAVPDSGQVELYCTLNEVRTASNDEPTMDSAFDGIFLGARTPDAITGTQRLVIGPFTLPALKSGQPYQFYIKNAQGDAAHDINSGWGLYITPVTVGPHA